MFSILWQCDETNLLISAREENRDDAIESAENIDCAYWHNGITVLDCNGDLVSFIRPNAQSSLRSN